MFFKLFWKEILIGVIILLCASAVGVLKYQLNSCKAKLAESKAQVVILSSAIETSNRELEKLGKATKEAQKRAVAANKKASAIAVATERKIGAIEAVKISPDGINATCEAQLSDIQNLLGAAR